MNLVTTLRSCAFACAASVLALAGPQTVQAQSLDEIYDGQTLTILIGHPPGGSYDLYAQLAAEYMGKYIPGNPNVIVQHMPGGGGRKAAAFFINNTEPDGMTVAVLPDSLGHIEHLRPDAANWDASKFRYIGRFASANAAFAVRADKATSAEDMKETEIIVACTGANARSAQQAQAMKNAAGLNLRLICGYDGSQATVLAALRGEADMLSQNWASFKSDPGDLGDGTLNILVQTGLERDPDLPDVPLMQELTDDPEGQAVLRYLGASAPIGRSMMIHPDTPEDIIDGLREAFQQMASDPEFLATAEQRAAIIDPRDGAEMEAAMAEIMAADETLLDAVRKAIDTSGAATVE
ncbi:MAG: tripartite tricarboxylate transporter substrate-binding protein [Rhodobacteraceae bacterium]|nr:tripartite tricarboxylate transporter substrate-binding protein [Paracoccaceae bacterium]